MLISDQALNITDAVIAAIDRLEAPEAAPPGGDAPPAGPAPAPEGAPD